MSQVLAQHLQQEQVLQLFPVEGGPLRLGYPAQQGQQEDLQVRVPLRGPRLGLLQPYQQVPTCSRIMPLDTRYI